MYMYMYMYIYFYIHMCVYIYIYTYTHISCAVGDASCDPVACRTLFARCLSWPLVDNQWLVLLETNASPGMDGGLIRMCMSRSERRTPRL